MLFKVALIAPLHEAPNILVLGVLSRIVRFIIAIVVAGALLALVNGRLVVLHCIQRDRVAGKEAGYVVGGRVGRHVYCGRVGHRVVGWLAEDGLNRAASILVDSRCECDRP